MMKIVMMMIVIIKCLRDTRGGCCLKSWTSVTCDMVVSLVIVQSVSPVTRHDVTRHECHVTMSCLPVLTPGDARGGSV